MSPTRSILGFLGWFGLCFATAALGAKASITAGRFYAQLARPDWAPPGWVFGPVWTLLYVLMALAAWEVWRRKGWSGATPALTLFLAQLVVNGLWSWLFFAWRRGAASMADVVLLLILLLATTRAFARVSTRAALLLAPYVVWVAFATALTFAVWRRNPLLLS